MKKILFLAIMPFITACFPCHTTLIDNGKLSDSALKLVPYQNEQIYSLQHSAGQVIHFKTQRTTTKGESRCTECCKNAYQYEVNICLLTPDYPIFSITFNIANYDSTYIDCGIDIGSSNFTIPTNKYQTENTEIIDSMIIDSFQYFNVYKLKANQYDIPEENSIFPDSLYYNLEFGILKIIMNDNESYKIIR